MICKYCESDKVNKNGKLIKDNEVIGQRYYCKSCSREFSTHFIDEIINDPDEEIILENVRLAKTKQSQMDKNRIERKSFREYARIENAVSEYAKAITKQNKDFAKELSKIKLPKIVHANNKLTGVIQLSDWHANEMIDLPNNKYDFNVLSARVKRLADESISLFTSQGITSILIAHCGDILNSDRRLDELLNQATNRSKASILTGYILTQFIMHLRQHFSISIVSVMGNESRMDKDWHSANNVVSDNYDYSIFAQLKQKFEFSNITDIKFGCIDKMETIVNINDQHWLITHDTNRASGNQKNTQSKIGSYYLKGTPIDFIIAGHIHSTRSTDLSSRSSSIAGSNEYNEHKMDLVGRAAQNIYVVGKDFRNTHIIDLQNVDINNCYNIIDELEEYNVQSHNKGRSEITVFKITI